MRGALGIAAILILAWLLSEARGRIAWRTVIGGVLLQIALALLLILFPPATKIFFLLNDATEALQKATDTGTGFVFGYLVGNNLPFAEKYPGASFILAFKALPLVLVISALASLMMYWGLLQAIMRAFAFVLRRTLGISGALALGAAVHIFVGMTEAPLLIRPWLARMQRGELFALMTAGMAGIAGTVMVIYGAILGPVVPNALANILIAAVISTPAAIAVAALMVPFEPSDDEAHLVQAHAPVSWVDAIIKGTADGVPVLVSIITVLLVAITLVSLVNMALGLLPFPITLQGLLAWPFQPLMWLLGIPWAETQAAATLMATKSVLNEFVAYLNLAALPEGALSGRSRMIMTYALCGFANFGSLGILVGGMGAMVPERRVEIVGLGFRSLVSGTLATCMSGAIAGILFPG